MGLHERRIPMGGRAIENRVKKLKALENYYIRLYLLYSLIGISEEQWAKSLLMPSGHSCF